MAEAPSDWVEYRRLVVSKLESLDASVKELDGKLDVALIGSIANMNTEIALLKFKCGAWGALGGVATAAIALAATYIKGTLN